MKKPFGLVLILLNAFMLIGCLDLTTDTSKEIKVGTVIPSPKETYLATSYLIQGGGAAGWCYQKVNIRKKDEAFDADKSVFTTRCSSELEADWADENNLNIRFSDESLFKPESVWGNVKISYYLIAKNK